MEEHQDPLDFAFAFDNPAFSDRVLKLLIFDDLLNKSENEVNEDSRLIDWMRSIQQRKKEVPESQKGSKVKSLHISSSVFAANSPFFFKLFSNGMNESNQKEVSLHIHFSEEAPLLNIFKFMHNKNLLSVQTSSALLEVLLVADKFDVPSCVKYCCKLLLAIPMTPELALSSIDLTSMIPIKSIEPLVSAAQDFLPNILKDIPKYRENILSLSLEGIKMILSHDDLQMESEDVIYDLFIEWTVKQFPNFEERQRVINIELCNLIRLQHMTPRRLRNVVSDLIISNNLDQEAVTSLVKALVPDESKTFGLKKCRLYKNRKPLVVTMNFEYPVTQCIAFLDLKREDFKDIADIYSETFILGEHDFYFRVLEDKRITKSDSTFGLFLYYGKTLKEPSTVIVTFEVSVRKNSSPQKFEETQKVDSIVYKQTSPAFGVSDLFNTSWESVMAEESQFFIEGCMHLMAFITII